LTLRISCWKANCESLDALKVERRFLADPLPKSIEWFESEDGNTSENFIPFFYIFYIASVRTIRIGYVEAASSMH
jgi:hypothetical protein